MKSSIWEGTKKVDIFVKKYLSRFKPNNVSMGNLTWM